ncbi:MAG: hypothetical protein IK079_01820, partial [Desulfovibrio sp.]|nr:hypothetical protein [Desulfovibrio sp.]
VKTGAMKGSALKQLYGYYSMWMTWASMNPEGTVIPGPSEVSEQLLKQKPIHELNEPLPTNPNKKQMPEEIPF